jgi:hypothetical protein
VENRSVQGVLLIVTFVVKGNSYNQDHNLQLMIYIGEAGYFTAHA